MKGFYNSKQGRNCFQMTDNCNKNNNKSNRITFNNMGLPIKKAIASVVYWPIITTNNTRQGYVLRNTLKQAGYLF